MTTEVALVIQSSTAKKAVLQAKHRNELLTRIGDILASLKPHSQGWPDQPDHLSWLHEVPADASFDALCDLYKERLKKVKGNDLRMHMEQGSKWIANWEEMVGFWSLAGGEENDAKRDELIVHMQHGKVTMLTGKVMRMMVEVKKAAGSDKGVEAEMKRARATITKELGNYTTVGAASVKGWEDALPKNLVSKMQVVLAMDVSAWAEA